MCVGEITGLGQCEPVQGSSAEPLPALGLFCVISNNFSVLLLVFMLTASQVFAAVANLGKASLWWEHGVH